MKNTVKKNSAGKDSAAIKKPFLAGFKEKDILLALIVISAVIYIINPSFLLLSNIEVILRSFAIIGIIAVGETMVIITSGIDLSPGSLIGLSGVLAGIFIVQMGMPTVIGILLVLVIGLLIGAMHGLFVAKLNIPPFIITLGTLMSARGLSALLTKGWPIVGFSDGFLQIGQGSFLGIPIPTVILIVVIIIGSFVLKSTVLGRHIYAIGGNENAAKLSGVKVDLVKIVTYAISGMLSAMTGIIVAARLSSAQPGVGGAYEMQAIASAVLGGASLSGGYGSLVGTLIGALILGVITNGLVLLKVSPYLYDIVTGVVVVAAVTLDTLRKRKK